MSTPAYSSAGTQTEEDDVRSQTKEEMLSAPPSPAVAMVALCPPMPPRPVRLLRMLSAPAAAHAASTSSSILRASSSSLSTASAPELSAPSALAGSTRRHRLVMRGGGGDGGSGGCQDALAAADSAATTAAVTAGEREELRRASARLQRERWLRGLGGGSSILGSGGSTSSRSSSMALPLSPSPSLASTLSSAGLSRGPGSCSSERPALLLGSTRAARLASPPSFSQPQKGQGEQEAAPRLPSSDLERAASLQRLRELERARFARAPSVASEAEAEAAAALQAAASVPLPPSPPPSPVAAAGPAAAAAVATQTFNEQTSADDGDTKDQQRADGHTAAFDQDASASAIDPCSGCDCGGSGVGSDKLVSHPPAAPAPTSHCCPPTLVARPVRTTFADGRVVRWGSPAAEGDGGDSSGAIGAVPPLSFVNAEPQPHAPCTPTGRHPRRSCSQGPDCNGQGLEVEAGAASNRAGGSSANDGASDGGGGGGGDARCAVCGEGRREVLVLHAAAAHRCACRRCGDALRVGDACPEPGCGEPVQGVLRAYAAVGASAASAAAVAAAGH